MVSNVFDLTYRRMSFSSYFTQAPTVFASRASVPSSSPSSLLPLPCPIAGRPAGRRTLSQPCGSILLPLPLLVPRRAPPVTARQPHPRFCPLVEPSLAACAQAAILPPAPIKASPEAPELAAPTPTPVSRHPCVDAPLHPHIVQTNPPFTFSASHQSCTAGSRALFLTRAPPPPPAPAAGSVPPPASHLGPPLSHPSHKQMQFVPLLALPTSPLAAGDPCRQKFIQPSLFPHTKDPFSLISIFLRRFP
jgi:hypothetical protein